MTSDSLQALANHVKALDSVFLSAVKGEPEAVVKATVAVLHISAIVSAHLPAEPAQVEDEGSTTD